MIPGRDGKALCPQGRLLPELCQSKIRSAYTLVASLGCRTFDVIGHCPIGIRNRQDTLRNRYNRRRHATPINRSDLACIELSTGKLAPDGGVRTSAPSSSPGLGLAWLGLAWLGLAWLGLAWLGLAWLGVEKWRSPSSKPAALFKRPMSPDPPRESPGVIRQDFLTVPPTTVTCCARWLKDYLCVIHSHFRKTMRCGAGSHTCVVANCLGCCSGAWMYPAFLAAPKRGQKRPISDVVLIPRRPFH